MRGSFCILAAALSGLLFFQWGCSGGKKEEKKTEGTPVHTGKAVLKDKPETLRTFGAVEAFSNVQIKSMVTGKLEKLCFTPGGKITSGQTLALIDARPFAATLKQLEARRDAEKASADDAARTSDMKARLRASGIIAEDEALRLKALAKAGDAKVSASEAEIEKAKLDLEYCDIKSPFDGRAGDILLHAGSLVKANDLPIVDVARTSPAYVAFDIPQRWFPKIQAKILAGQTIRVRAVIPETGIEESGKLTFIDKTVNKNSGTVRLKAEFENKNEVLWPGLYLVVYIYVDEGKNVLTVPSDAVQMGQNGHYLYAVKPDMTIEKRNAAVERNDETDAVLKSGAAEGETVVTDGHIKLVPGARIRPVDKNPGAEKPAAENAKDKK